jgi:hypothetical protein
VGAAAQPAILGAKGLQITTFTLKANELDTRNEARDVAKAQALYEIDALVPDEARGFFGLDALPNGRGQKTKSESAPPPAPSFGGFGGLSAIDGGLLAKRWGTEVQGFAAIRKRLEEIASAA